MKKIFLIFSLIIFTLSCKKNRPNNDSVVGIWEPDSMLIYFNGKENLVKLEETKKMWIGSKSNPNLIEFTKYQEAFIYESNYTGLKDVIDFNIKNDTLFLTTNEFVDTVKIIDFDQNNISLQFETKYQMFDNSKHSKNFNTVYYHKKI